MATGMITRHFDHPSGATATLEMPAGWSRNCYYVMTLQRTNGEHGVAPERVTCNTPEDARQRAIERERAALANGWRPRTTSRAPAKAGNEINIHQSGGRRLPVSVDSVKVGGPGYLCDHRPATFLLARTFMICAHGETGDIGVVPGDRVLIHYRVYNADQTAAAVVKGIDLDFDVDRADAFYVDIEAEQVMIEPSEVGAIERFHSREQVILDLLDDPDPSIMHLYQEISKRVQEPEDRPQVQQEILRRRAELQAAEIREREAAVSRERAAAEAAVARTLPTRPRQQTIPAIQQDVKAAMRRLAGGQDIGAPKRRKIDLGE